MRNPEPRRRAVRKQETRRRGAVALSVCAVLVLVLAGGLMWAAGEPPAGSSRIGGPFRLSDTAGQFVTDRDFRGRWMLVYFGYTACPDICPTTLHEMGVTMQVLGPAAARVRPVFITVDPARDTAAVLRDYLAGFDPRLIGLTGTPGEVAAAERAYRIISQVHRTGDRPNDYVVDHSSVLFLMDPHGRFVAPIPADASGERMAQEIRKRVG